MEELYIHDTLRFIIYFFYLGHYIFIDASQQKQGDVARLYSESINRHRISFIPYCLRFWYHMKGPNIGTLSIILKTGPGKTFETTMWSLAGNQVYGWKQGTVPMYSTSDYIVSSRIILPCYLGNAHRLSCSQLLVLLFAGIHLYTSGYWLCGSLNGCLLTK